MLISLAQLSHTVSQLSVCVCVRVWLTYQSRWLFIKYIKSVRGNSTGLWKGFTQMIGVVFVRTARCGCRQMTTGEDISRY